MEDDHFKIYSVVKRPVGTAMMSMQYLFAENRFVVACEDFEHCLDRARDIGLVRFVRHGRCRLTRKICDAHIKGLFRKFLEEKRSRMTGSSIVNSGLSGLLKKSDVPKDSYRKVQPVARKAAKSDAAKRTGQSNGMSKKVRRLIDAMRNIRGMRGDSHGRNIEDISYNDNIETGSLINNATEARFMVPTKDVSDQWGGLKSSNISNQDLLKNCWKEINFVLEAVTDEEFLNLRVHDQIYDQLEDTYQLGFCNFFYKYKFQFFPSIKERCLKKHDTNKKH